MNHVLAKSANTKSPVPMPNVLVTDENQAHKIIGPFKTSKLLPEALHTNNVQFFRLYSWN